MATERKRKWVQYGELKGTFSKPRFWAIWLHLFVLKKHNGESTITAWYIWNILHYLIGFKIRISGHSALWITNRHLFWKNIMAVRNCGLNECTILQNQIFRTLSVSNHTFACILKKDNKVAWNVFHCQIFLKTQIFVLWWCEKMEEADLIWRLKMFIVTQFSFHLFFEVRGF